MDAINALKTFELENDIQNIDSSDAIYKYDDNAQKNIINSKPWNSDPNYFKTVMHARSGKNIEIMGLLQGKIIGDTMVVMDTFALPVEGTETRVNAQAEGYEYMVEYMRVIKEVGRLENVLGWYHSHPGYGCWLSGIDVSTQMLNQQYQEPFVAIVVDPTRTITAGKVDIGAFRTYPENYVSQEGSNSEYQSIPLNKIEDFGVHCKRYYPLNISYFRSSLDSKLLELLWNKYWVSTLSTSPLIMNRPFLSAQIRDVAAKLEQTENGITQNRLKMEQIMNSDKDPLDKLYVDSQKMSCEGLNGLINLLVKNMAFGTDGIKVPL